MSLLRRAIAAAPVAALAVASPAHAAPAIRSLPCVGYVEGQQTMPIFGTGFTPGGAVTVYTNSAAEPKSRLLVTPNVNAIGAFQLPVAPPPFSPASRQRQTFKLIAQDSSVPGGEPVVVSSSFEVVRFGLSQRPAASYPHQPVTYTARGFRPGKLVYAHFRFAGVTRVTVSLGIAQPPCGITSKRMRALPTKIRYGDWQAYIDQTKAFSARTRPQWIDTFSITPPKRKPAKTSKR